MGFTENYEHLMNQINEIEELEKQIKYHNDLYWNGKPIEISDVEYDKLVNRLKELSPDNDLILEIEKPIFKSTDKLVMHSKPMLSLDKIYSKEKLIEWVKKMSRGPEERFKIQPKYDGMSGLLENGVLSSRGDGLTGQDYTDKLKIIEFESNKKIDISKDTLLGEIVIRNDYFKTIFSNIKSKTGTTFKNQRNGIAGILGTDDVDFYYNQGAKITFVDYELNTWYTTCKDFEKDWDEILNTIRTTMNYPMDGIVIKLADEEYSESKGYTSHHPKGQVAFKFTNQTAITKLIGIEWGMGKQQISAIGLIEPVEISGSTIRRVKLQLTKPKNASIETYLLDGSLQIGDTIVIERAGDIIPHVVSSTPGTDRTKVIIDTCPFCGSPTIINETSVLCSNRVCKEIIIQELYASVMTLGFKNVGESYIRTLVGDPNLHIMNISDLISLKPEDLKLKEYGTRKKEIFFEEIEKAKNTAAKEIVLTAMNIPNVGKTVSKLLVENFSWEDIIEGNFSFEDLEKIDGIGHTIADSIKTYVGRGSNISYILKKMTNMFKFPEKKIENNSNKLTICFTGKMEHKRSEMENLAREKGFIPIDHVDKSLNILVCADPNSGSSKLQKAAKYGTKIISEQDFMNGNF